MATLDQLLAKLPDNDTGEITAEDLRDVITGVWNRTLIGGVLSDGTLVDGPPGWSAMSSQQGLYTVTHNLGTAYYAVLITPLAKTVDGWSAAVEATSAESFTFGTYSASHGGLHGVYSNFLVVTR